MVKAITQAQLCQMLVEMDQTGDGTVSKEEFRLPYMKLNPHATPDEYDEVWAGADVNGDGSLQPEELAAYFGFDWSSLAKDMDDLKLQNSNEMSDEDILNALLMEQALRDLKSEQERKVKEEEEAALRAQRPRLSGLRASRDMDGIEIIKIPTKITDNEVDDPDPQSLAAKIEFLAACQTGAVSKIISDIEKGVSVRIEDDQTGEMPLHKVCRWGHVNAAKEILRAAEKEKRGARHMDLNVKNKQGRSPLFVAAEFKQTDMVKYLLDQDHVDLRLQTSQGWCILHAIVNSNDKALLMMFLAHPHVVEDKKWLMGHKDAEERTPLHIASFKCHEDIVAELLNNLQEPEGAGRERRGSVVERRGSVSALPPGFHAGD
jgi:hypothetical protein